jgi:hypothetical protein
MSNAFTQTVEERLDSAEVVDHSPTLGRLWGIVTELRDKVAAATELATDPALAPFAEYGTPDGSVIGRMVGHTGPLVEHFVTSYLAAPASGFTNLHFNLWLRPEVRTPHISVVFGTFPDLFFFADYVPRVDPWVDAEYLDRYYEPVNDLALRLHEDPAFTRFVSRTVYMRQAASPNAQCFTAEPTAENIAAVAGVAHGLLDHWLTYLRDPEPVPAEEQPLLRDRDRALRRHAGERDPANGIGVRMFGEERTQELLSALWGWDR